MLKTKTHFEQVPLETVRKMVEQQIQRETAREQERKPRARRCKKFLSGYRNLH